MSLNSLLESANPYSSLQSDAARLASKWEKTGLLEGMNGAQKNNMGMILENQAKQLVVESSQTSGGTGNGGTFSSQTGVNVGGQWAGVALPLVRKVFGQIAAQEFVSVQPMNLPSGLVFFLDFQYGSGKSPFTAGDSLYGDKSAAENPFGNGNTGGLYGSGRFGYSIQNTQSLNVTATDANTTWDQVNFNGDYSASVIAGDYRTISVPAADLPFADLEAVKGFQLFSGSLATTVPVGTGGIVAGAQVSEFTTYDGTNVNFVILDSAFSVYTDVSVNYQIQPTDNNRGDFEAGNANPNAYNETSQVIPEINIQMQSSAIVAKTRKLKAVWTPEFAQDLNAYHALDAEAELTSILSEYISLEIDLEILSMLIEGAAAGTENWSAVNNQSITGTGAGITQSDLGFYNSQGQWFQTLGTKIQKLSNIIHQKTLRGGANFMVVSPTVATILESIPGFAADTDGDAAKMSYAFGVQKVGALNSRQKVYKNPYMTANTILLGYRGTQFLESGAVFAPYIPLIMTPLVYDPETFVPRKGLLTRYAKKMVRPEFYGTINVAGLNTL